MNALSINRFYSSCFSLLIVMLLSVLPLPFFVSWFWPNWVLLWIIFGIVDGRYRGKFGMVFLIGIVLDVLKNTLIGEHSLILLFPTLIASMFQQRLMLFPPMQQAIYVGVLTAIGCLIQFWIHSMLGFEPVTWQFLASVLGTALVWPWFQSSLRALDRWFKVPRFVTNPL